MRLIDPKAGASFPGLKPYDWLAETRYLHLGLAELPQIRSLASTYTYDEFPRLTYAASPPPCVSAAAVRCSHSRCARG